MICYIKEVSEKYKSVDLPVVKLGGQSQIRPLQADSNVKIWFFQSSL